MSQNQYQVLNHILDVYSSNPSLADLRKQLAHKTLSPSSTDDIDDIVSIYQAAIPIIGTELWSAEVNGIINKAIPATLSGNGGPDRIAG